MHYGGVRSISFSSHPTIHTHTAKQSVRSTSTRRSSRLPGDT